MGRAKKQARNVKSMRKVSDEAKETPNKGPPLVNPMMLFGEPLREGSNAFPTR